LDEEEAVYVSDRRWQRAAVLLKASAFLCDRKTTNLTDTLLLRHCLWTTAQNRNSVVKIVEDAVKNSGLSTGANFAELEKEKERLDEVIASKFYSADYDTIPVGEEELDCLHVLSHEIGFHNNDYEEFYIPIEKRKTNDDFHPLDPDGDEIESITCSFEGQVSCTIKNDDNDEEAIFTPEPLTKRGKRMDGVTEYDEELYSGEVRKLQGKFEEVLKKVSSQKNEVEQQLETPFVSEEIRLLAYKSISGQIDKLNRRIRNCDVMLAKMASEVNPEEVP